MGFESLYKLSVIMSVVDNVSGPIGKMGQSASSSAGALGTLSNVFANMTKTGTLMAGAGVQLGEALMSPVEATFETKRAISELSSLGVEQLGMIEDAAKDFSNTWAGTTKSEFISAAYDIKSGIASLTDEGVAQFTELAGITATATKSSIGTMTNLFATGYGIYKDYYNELSDLEFGEMFSAGIAQSVKQFKTNGDEMSAAIQTLGASATNAQIPLEEQLSILGMLQATMSGSEAGTKYNAFLRSAVKGGEALGLSFVDANNQMLSMPEILDMLHSKFGDTIDAAEKMQLQEAFGDSESVKLIDLMYNKVGDLENNIVSMYGSLGRGTEATLEMADAINSSDPAAFELIQQKAHNVAETIGNIVSPKVREYGQKVSGALEKVEEWASGHEELVTKIFSVLAVLAVFLTVGGVVITTIGLIGGTVTKTIRFFQRAKEAVGILGGAFNTALPALRSFGSSILNMARTAITSLVSAMSPMIASVWSFTTALLANPVTWIVIGIVALIAAIILLYNKCEWFRNLVNQLGEALKEGFGKALEIVTAVFSAIANFIGSSMEKAKNFVSEKLQGMKDTYNEHGGGIKGAAAVVMKGVTGVFTAGYNAIDNLTGGKLTELKNKWSEKLAPVKEVAGTIMNAAKDTIVEKLGNIKNAYVQNGGGIKGIAAAAVEGVKGYYTAGFTFIDNLTGGKLTAIKNKFAEGINGIKTKISDSISWFKNSGKKIMDTFTEGIKSALNAPVEMVKSGLQKIRNMLPFSDAKEGPLSQLTLSGSKVLTTLTTGIKSVEDAPAEAVEESFSKINLSASPYKTAREKEKETVSRTELERETNTTETKKTVIEKLILNVDLKSIEDLNKLKKLLDEIEDHINSNDNDDGLQPA